MASSSQSFNSSWASSRPSTLPIDSPTSKKAERIYYDSYEPTTSKSAFDSDKEGNISNKLWMWIGIAVAAVLVIALAVGLGVGLTRQGGSDGDTNNDASTSAVTGTAASSSGGSSTTSSSATASSTNTAVRCPSSNGTTYTRNSKSFRIECGIDYASTGNFDTLGATNLAACLDACAVADRCIDATFLGSACYLKDSIGDPNYENSGVAGGRLIE